MAVYLASTSMDAAAALSLGEALRAGTGLWTLGLGGAWQTGTLMGAVTLPALGLTALDVWLIRSSLRRANLRPWSSAVLLGLAVTTGAAALVALTGGRAWVACLVLGVLSTGLALWQIQRRGYGSARLTRAWAAKPAWLRLSLVMTRDCLAVLVLGGLAVLTAAVIGGASRVLQLHDALTGGAVVATLGVIGLELAWAPTALVWAMSWLVGSGFSVGQGTSIAPDHVVSGGVPVLPALGLLPSTPVGGDGSRLGLYLPLVVTAAAVAVALLQRPALVALQVRQSIGAAAVATALVTCAVTMACLAGRGAVGPGRMAAVGPNAVLAAALVAAQIGAGLILTAIAVHPTTRRLTGTGARAAAGAIAGAASGVRSPGQPAQSSGEPTEEIMKHPARLVVLVSGTGSNLAALVRACQDPAYGAQIVGVVADKECPGLDHARQAGVPALVVSPQDCPDRHSWDQALTQAVADLDPDLIVCAGFMRILGQPFLERFEGSVINTHPSLLPDFPGAHAVRDALAAGATRAGATLFWVDAGIDTGEHIAQVEVTVEPEDTEETLTARIKAAETPQLVEQVGILARGLRERR